ncbi:MFS transporter [Streptomyces ochraceiscleroticus]|uniref:MFS transporter n=1 Tax=Streptomyces ochraceiscleroticus TaxID=47761 RepID=A0ABW1MXP7_9ACTN
MPRPAAAAAGTRPWGLLTVLAGNMLIDALEVSVLVVAAPAIGADLHLAPAGTQWTMSGFALGFAGLLLLGPRLAARWGRRRLYLTALAVFAVASLVAGIATDPVLLVATRFVKGGCAALTAPMGLAIIMSVFPEGPVRRRAISVYTLFGASGFATGLLLSGLLTGWDWRYTLAFPAPVVAVLFVAGLRLIPAQEPGEGAAGAARQPLPLARVLLLTAGTAALVGGIAHVPTDGWTGPRTAGLLLTAVVLFALLVVRERRSAAPILPASVRASAALRRSALGAACLNGSYLGMLFIATLQLQDELGRSPLQTALAFLPASLPLALTALHSGAMVERFGARPLIALGSLAAFAGYLLLLRENTSYVTGLLPSLLLVGAGFVLAFTALNTQAVSEAAGSEKAVAGAAYQTAVQAGAALMPALAAALLTTGTGTPDHRSAHLLVAAVGLLGVVTALAGPGRVFRIIPGPRRLARHLAALSHCPRTTRYEGNAPPCDAPHQTPRPDPG